jgi:hypothetical protein
MLPLTERTPQAKRPQHRYTPKGVDFFHSVSVMSQCVATLGKEFRRVTAGGVVPNMLGMSLHAGSP